MTFSPPSYLTFWFKDILIHPAFTFISISKVYKYDARAVQLLKEKSFLPLKLYSNEIVQLIAMALPWKKIIRQGCCNQQIISNIEKADLKLQIFEFFTNS